MILIKKQIKNIFMLCVILAFFSCTTESNINITDEKDEPRKDITEQLKDLAMTEPDKIIENLNGILYYDKRLEIWIFNHSILGTIDSNERYMIVDMPNNSDSFEEGKEALVSGLCYKIPTNIIIDLAKDNIVFPAGTVLFYLEITDFK